MKKQLNKALPPAPPWPIQDYTPSRWSEPSYGRLTGGCRVLAIVDSIWITVYQPAAVLFTALCDGRKQIAASMTAPPESSSTIRYHNRKNIEGRSTARALPSVYYRQTDIYYKYIPPPEACFHVMGLEHQQQHEHQPDNVQACPTRYLIMQGCIRNGVRKCFGRGAWPTALATLNRSRTHISTVVAT